MSNIAHDRNHQQHARFFVLSAGASVVLIWGHVLPAYCQRADAASGPSRVQLAAAEKLLALSFSPDNALLAASTTASEVSIVSVRSGAVQKVLNGDGKEVSELAFHPDGKKLASGGPRGTIQWWNISDAEAERSFEIEGKAVRTTAIAFAPNGTLFAAATIDGSVGLWDGNTGAQRQYFRHRLGKGAVAPSLALSNNGSVAVAATMSYEVAILSTVTGMDITRFDSSPRDRLTEIPVASMADAGISRNGREVTCVWSTRAIRMKVGEDAHFSDLGKHFQAVSATAMSSDCSVVAMGSSDGGIELWDPRSGEHLGALRGHMGPVCALAVSADGKFVASGDDRGRVSFWRK